MNYARKAFPVTRKRMLEKLNDNIVKPARATFCYEMK